MKSHNYVYRQTVAVALGQMICVGMMVGIFALLGKFQLSVLWGGLAGALIAIANFFIMSLCADIAADKAEAQDVSGGQKLIQLSYTGRMIGLFLILFLCAKSGFFHLVALVIPLAFTRPVLTVSELLKKKGGQ
jgi:ABC-type multidrug transport system permease subunit